MFFRKSVPVNETDAVYLNVERNAVRSIGGTPNLRLLGPDGTTTGLIKRPIEVKYADKDFRFRIGKHDHELMLKKNGIYVFITSDGRKKILPALYVDRLLRYKWLKDRQYPHSFIFVSDVFGR